MKKFFLAVGLILIATSWALPLHAAEKLSKKDAVATMIKMIKSREQPQFAVLIRKYYIESRPYRTLMITVSKEHTPDIKQTKNGFVATGIFRESMLHHEARTGKVVKNGLVRARVEVRYEDIWAISGKTADGKQINLLR